MPFFCACGLLFLLPLEIKCRIFRPVFLNSFFFWDSFWSLIHITDLSWKNYYYCNILWYGGSKKRNGKEGGAEYKLTLLKLTLSENCSSFSCTLFMFETNEVKWRDRFAFFFYFFLLGNQSSLLPSYFVIMSRRVLWKYSASLLRVRVEKTEFKLYLFDLLPRECTQSTMREKEKNI